MSNRNLNPNQMQNGVRLPYNDDNILKFIELVKKFMPTRNKKQGKVYYKVYDIPCSFDIETTSMLVDGKKVSFMYIWQFGINGICVYGRTWDEYTRFIELIVSGLNISQDMRLYCYVHNLGYEFQFMRKYFSWETVFSSTERTPIYALASSGIEYRCSLILTNMKLDDVGKELKKHDVRKLVGNLNYNLIRTYKTKLTEDEMDYCINDILVVMAFIEEEIERCGSITKIPLTKTGYVRNYVRNACFKDRKKYKNLMDRLIITSDEYLMLKEAFQGGFTHANINYSGLVMENVQSYDFTSSYPTVMIAEKFPMSRGRKVQVLDKAHFFRNLNNYCCLFKIELKDVKVKDNVGDVPISKSKCTKLVNPVCDNGRVRSCEYLEMTITECDFQVYTRFYDFQFKCSEMIIYDKAYLPKPIIQSIIKFYADKTELKDVKGMEDAYSQAKCMINAIYGMIVMDVVRDEITYDNRCGWDNSPANIEKQIDDYNSSKNRFLFYPWGVWVTAYARRNLFMGILECGQDYLYADTDSIKVVNHEKHLEFINKYNESIKKKIYKAMEFHKLDKYSCEPKNQKGKSKPLGVWDDDGFFIKFKTLGAKRYMKLTPENKLETTIAGVGKKSACEYIKNTFENPFTAFENNLYIPAENTGKLTHTYIDDEFNGFVTDFQGNTVEVNQKSAVHLGKCDFTVGMSDEYMELLIDIQTVERMV